MNTVTHALMPLVAARLCAGQGRIGWKAYLAIAAAGAMPDLINPHIYLESRMTSWSHGIPFWAGFTALMVLISITTSRRLPLWMAIGVSMACLLHILCDTISGGVNLLYPVKDYVWGEYWVSLVWWIPIDIVLLLSSYYLFRLAPMRKRLKEKRRSSQT